MRVLDRLQESWYKVIGRTELAEVVRAKSMMVEHLQESIADLENRAYEPGWQRLTAQAEQEFTRDGLRQITAVCRVVSLKNPLIKRGLSLRTSYVWGQGVEVGGRDEQVNDIIQAFHDDPGNRRTLIGQQACEELDRSLGTDGNVFIALFTSPRTGRVQARTLPWDEITDVISNPEDSSETRFYRREWWADEAAPGGYGVVTRRRTALYPALGYRPPSRPRRMPDRQGEPVEVIWDAPVYHVKVGGLQHWKFGVPDAYAAIDWAMAYKDFLSDWAVLIKALSRYAYRLTSKGSKQAAAKTRLAAAPSHTAVGDPNHAGATAMLTPDMTLEAVPKTGATIDSESGRPLAAMVAAALDLPVTMLLGDPGVTGNRATAETLDAPTERSMQSRQQVWAEARRAIYGHVITEAVRARRLPGRIMRDEFGRETLEFGEGIDGTIDISFPDLDDVDVATVVEAITKADATTYLPPLTVARLLLEALGVDDVDQILQQLTDDAGNFLHPDGAGGGAGQAAVDAFRRGEDPAALMAGEPVPPEPAPAGASGGE
jgi:hypothetical protein